MASSINHYASFGQVNGKLEYTMVQYQIPYEYVNHTLYLMIRAVNFTVTDEEQLNSCAQVYLEIEFRETPRDCKYGKIPQSSSNVISISKD